MMLLLHLPPLLQKTQHHPTMLHLPPLIQSPLRSLMLISVQAPMRMLRLMLELVSTLLALPVPTQMLMWMGRPMLAKT